MGVYKELSEVPRILLWATCLNADRSDVAVFHRTKIWIDGANHVWDVEYTTHRYAQIRRPQSLNL